MTPVNGATAPVLPGSVRRLRVLHEPDPEPTGPAELDPVTLSALTLAEERAADEVRRARSVLPDLDRAAFGCYLGDLAAALDPTTEADPVAVLASLLAAAGVHLGPGPHVRAGDDRHPLLVWPLVIGRTSAGRKGASWGTARRLLAEASPEFMATNVRSGLTSGEGLAALFAEPDPEPTRGRGDDDHDDDTPALDGSPGRPARAKRTRPAAGGLLPVGDRRLLVLEPEWAAVMARMRREGNSLSATLRAAWEGGDLSTMNVTARIAPTSHVGLLAHITPGEFAAKVNASDLAGGTYNRFLPVAVARSKFLPNSTGADPDLLADLGADLAARLTIAARLGTLSFTPAGQDLWRQLYVEFGTDHGDAGPVEQFISRTAPNCLRIAAIHAALDRTPAIGPQHLTAAAALVRYSVQSARATLGSDLTLTRLAAWIANAGPAGRTRTDITVEFFGRKEKADTIAGYLDTLAAQGHITRTHQPRADGKPGRAREVFTTTTTTTSGS